MNGVYPSLAFPAAPSGRPYVAMNMVSTLDGKIYAGHANQPVGLGSAVDKATMRQIESAVDGIMIGHNTLKASPGLWYPAGPRLFVVSGSGEVARTGRFFTDDPSRAEVITSESGPIDFKLVFQQLTQTHNIRTLLVEGGSQLNASLFAHDLVDELFLTLAPVVKLGRDVPTIADGDPLRAEALPKFQLVSSIPVGDELFLRYRRVRAA